MTIEVNVESGLWADTDVEALAVRACLSVLTHVMLDADSCEINILACDDARIVDLNAEFRGKPQPTNVLSWPAEDLGADIPGQLPQRPSPDFAGEIALGDIALAFETCAREAGDLGKPMAEHLSHLVVHGTLHLLGYDHVADDDSALMQNIEAEILGKLGYQDPYI